MKKLLVIGRTIPEPSTTAAGVRMMSLLNVFSNLSYEIVFATTATASEYSVDLFGDNISLKYIEINSSSFNEFLESFPADVVIFDRFISEEQFGWRVNEVLPNALKILDTEDLHFLREARGTAIKNGVPFENDQLYTEHAKRELASILRCNLSLIISEFEMNLLQHQFKIPEELLLYLPFLIDPSQISNNAPSFQERRDFISIGNFFHKPNLDAVKYLKEELWPGIKQQLPKVNIRVYGAYAPQQVIQMHNEKEGFLIQSWASDLPAVMSSARVCLAPLRFGAGLKGKLLDAMLYKTPMATTSMGAEGMYGDFKIPGIVSDTPIEFIKSTVELYKEEAVWKESLGEVDEILKNRFNKDYFEQTLIERVEYLFANLTQHRRNHFIIEIIQHQSLQSTKYMSKWIEAKNKKSD